MTEYFNTPTSPVDEAIRELPSRSDNDQEVSSNSLRVPFGTITSGAKSLLNNVHFWGNKSPDSSIRSKTTPQINVDEEMIEKITKENNQANGSKSPELHKSKSTDNLASLPRVKKLENDSSNRNSFANFPDISNSDIPKETMEFPKSRTKNKYTRDFDKMFVSQILMKNGKDTSSFSKSNINKAENDSTKSGAIWTFRFSNDGEYLAAGGQDGAIRIWGLRLIHQQTEDELDEAKESRNLGFTENFPIFTSAPIRTFEGHQSDVLDLSWSKTGFLLSSSTDKTVRLWHVKRQECLCVYQHMDFVTSVAFHPKNDRYFISGSLDCRIRLWNIPEKKVSSWAELPDGNLVTAVGFSVDGKLAIAGSYHGLCVIYKTEGLKPHSQIIVKSGAKTRAVVARKITGIEAIPDPNIEGGKIMITSNDSRIRIYNINDLSLDQKLKGPENNSNQIKASFSDDLKFVVCGSENNQIYLFNLNTPLDKLDLHSTRKNFLFKKKEVECSYEVIEGHNNIVTVAALAPTTTKKILAQINDPLINPTFNQLENPVTTSFIQEGHILVSADCFGNLKVFRRNTLPAPYTPSLKSILFDDNLSIHKLGRISKEITRSLRRERKGSDASSRTSRSNYASVVYPNDSDKVTENQNGIISCAECKSNSKIMNYIANPVVNLPEQNNEIAKENIKKSITDYYANHSTASLPLQSLKLANGNVVNPTDASQSFTTPSSPAKNNFITTSNSITLTICHNCKKVIAGLT